MELSTPCSAREKGCDHDSGAAGNPCSRRRERLRKLYSDLREEREQEPECRAPDANRGGRGHASCYRSSAGTSRGTLLG